jgi:hypothetical protein
VYRLGVPCDARAHAAIKRRPTDRPRDADRPRTSRAAPPRGAVIDARRRRRARARFERRGRSERRDATRTRARGTRSVGFWISGVVGRARYRETPGARARGWRSSIAG